MWSIYLKPSVLIEESEVAEMLQRFPHAANHDPSNYIFVSTHPNAVNPVLVSEFVDADGEQLSGDALVAAIAVELFADNRSRAIHLSKSNAIALHAHPAWQLWCGNYEDKDSLEADHEKVFGAGVDRRKTLDSLVDESRIELKGAFSV